MARSQVANYRPVGNDHLSGGERALSGLHLLFIGLVWLVLFIPLGLLSLVTAGVSQLIHRGRWVRTPKPF